MTLGYAPRHKVAGALAPVDSRDARSSPPDSTTVFIISYNANSLFRHNLGDEKRMAIMQWMESCEPIMVDEERLPERMQSECIILSHPLEDIIEIDEESMKDSTKSRGTHPLRILSKEAINQVDSTEKAAALVFALSSF